MYNTIKLLFLAIDEIYLSRHKQIIIMSLPQPVKMMAPYDPLNLLEYSDRALWPPGEISVTS